MKKIAWQYLGRNSSSIAMAVLIGSLTLSVSYAHQQKTAVTRILFTPYTDNIEVIHRFFVHDAEHAATEVFGQQQTLMESAESRELFSNYVMNRFAIEATFANGEHQQLALQYMGEEIDGQFLWVYQEIQQITDISALTIVNMALRDVWPDQSNLVNIELENKILSLTFDGTREMLTISL